MEKHFVVQLNHSVNAIRIPNLHLINRIIDAIPGMIKLKPVIYPVVYYSKTDIDFLI